MAIRHINDEFWTDPYVLTLDGNAQRIYLYCIFNWRQKPHGIFHATSTEIGVYLKLKPEVVEKCLRKLHDDGKIKWLVEQEKIWNKDFLLTQLTNPNIFLGIRKLLALESPALIDEYIAYYNNIGFWKKHKIDLDYLLSDQTDDNAECYAWHKWAREKYSVLSKCDVCGSTTNLARHCPNHNYSKRESCDILCNSCHPKANAKTIKEK